MPPVALSSSPYRQMRAYDNATSGTGIVDAAQRSSRAGAGVADAAMRSQFSVPPISALITAYPSTSKVEATRS